MSNSKTFLFTQPIFAIVDKKERYLIIWTVVLVILIIWFSIRPSNDRNWSPDQKVLSYVGFNGSLVDIYNIRNNTYRSTSDFDVHHYNKTFDLDKIKKVYYVVEPFTGIKGSAHTFFTFEFEDNEFVAISVEIRKEVGEAFSGTKGLFKQYEIMYVIGDEMDLIKLRTNYRKDKVYLYPVKAAPEMVRMLFVDMLIRVNELYSSPEFYNTLTNTCTINQMNLVNEIYPGTIPFNYKILLPEYSDTLAYQLGLIDTNLTFEHAREKFKINDGADACGDCADFSLAIREQQ